MQTPQASTAAKIVSILIMLGAILALIPAAFAMLMSVMIFDAPGSTAMVGPWALALSTWLFPVFLVLAIVAAVRNMRSASWAGVGWSLGFIAAGIALFLIAATQSGAM